MRRFQLIRRWDGFSWLEDEKISSGFLISAHSGVSGSQAGGPLYLRNNFSHRQKHFSLFEAFCDIRPENIAWQKSEKLRQTFWSTISFQDAILYDATFKCGLTTFGILCKYNCTQYTTRSQLCQLLIQPTTTTIQCFRTKLRLILSCGLEN